MFSATPSPGRSGRVEARKHRTGDARDSLGRSLRRIAVACVIAAAVTGCSTFQQRPPAPTLPEVVQMVKDKVPDEQIIARLRDSGAVYRLQGSDYAKLRADGVSDAVLDFIFRQQMDDARYQEWLASRDSLFWGPYGVRPLHPFSPYGPYWSPFGPPVPFYYGR
jgi:hypothetical protein